MKRITKNTWLLSMMVFGFIAFIFSACSSDDNGVTADELISIKRVYNITAESAEFYVSLGTYNDQMTEFNLIYGTDEKLDDDNPDTKRNPIQGVDAVGTLTVTLSGLLANRVYYAAPEIVYAEGEPRKGSTVQFKTLGSVLHGGHDYPTVAIGEQVWMAENLRTTEYANGELIESEHYFAYGGEDESIDNYGLLYTYAAIQSGDICPEGWRVPTDPDWTKLTKHLDSTHPAKAPGDILKSTRTAPQDDHPRWDAVPDYDGGLNLYGFNALPGGYLYADGSTYDKLGEYAMFWTSTPKHSDESGQVLQVWRRQLFHDMPEVGRFFNYTTHAFSIRCVKDVAP